MRPPTHSVMSKHRAQNQLSVEHEDRQQREREEAGTAAVKFDLRNFFDPPASGEHGNRNRDAEECLPHCGVCRGDPRRLKQEHCKPAENCLRNHCAESGNAQPLHPTATVCEPCPSGNGNRQHDDGASNGAMAPFVFDSTVERRNVERTEGSWPVGNGEAGIVAGDERTGNDENKSRARREDSKAMVRAIVRCGEGFQIQLLIGSAGKMQALPISPATAP